MRSPFEKRWANFFMDFASNVKNLSYSEIEKVGAVLVEAETLQILGFGYNALPRGSVNIMETRNENGELVPLPDIITAVQNVLLCSRLPQNPLATKVLYTTKVPSAHDAVLIANSNVYYVIVPNLDGDPDGLLKLDEYNITVYTIDQLQDNVSDDEKIRAHLAKLMAEKKETKETSSVDSAVTGTATVSESN